MTCDQRRDNIFLYAAGALEPAERNELRAHLSGGCATCAGTLAQAEATLSDLPLALPPVTPPPEARDRLMSRITAAPSLRIAGAAREPVRPRTGNIARWALVSALTGIAAGIILAFALLPEPDKKVRDELADAKSRLEKLDAQITSAQDAIKTVNAEKLRLVSLESPNRQDPKQPTGRILYDEDNGLWHVRVVDLKPLPKEKIYELWFILPGTGAKPIAAGTFNTNADGTHSMFVKIPPGLKDISLGAITEEPAPGGEQPTQPTNLKLAGQVEKKPA